MSDDNDPHLMPSASVVPWLLQLHATHEIPQLPTMVSWADDHPLAEWASFLYGESYAGDAARMAAWGQLATTAPPVDIASSARLPGGENALGFLDIGMAGLSTRSDSHDAGIFVMDDASVDDLVDCWNLRALGADVVPWSSERADLAGNLLTTIQPRLRWARLGDGTDTRILSVWFPRSTLDAEDRPVVPDELVAFAEQCGSNVTTWMSRPGLPYSAGRFGGLSSQFDTPFSADVDKSAAGWTVRVPLPALPFRSPDREDVNRHFLCTRVRTQQATGVPDEFTLAVPTIRALDGRLRQAAGYGHEHVRSIADGIAVVHSADDDHLSLTILNGGALIAGLLSDAGAAVSISSEGRWTSQILRSLGGIHSSLSSHQAVRDVLDAAASGGGRPLQTLTAAAKRVASPQANLWFRSDPYHEWVVGHLIYLGAINPVLQVQCPLCGLNFDVSPHDLEDTIPCANCGEDTALGILLMSRPAWRFRTKPLLERDRLRCAFPTLSAVRALIDSVGDHAGFLPPFLLGVNVAVDDDQFEIDWMVALQDGADPVVVVGESKAREQQLGLGDLDKLHRVRLLFERLGITCVVAVSLSRDTIKGDEKALLREFAERTVDWFESSEHGVGQGPNLPLILTKRRTTAPLYGGNGHLVELANGWINRLRRLSEGTCRESLGLTDVSWDPNDSRLRLVWDQTEPTS